MQKKIIALAVAGLMSGAAFAQTNVTLSGNFDAGLLVAKAQNNNGSTEDGAYSNASTTQLFIQAREDLGGGMYARVFTETGLNGGWGNAQRFIALGGSFGELSIGQRNNFSVQTAAVAQPFGTAIGSGYSGLFGRLNGIGAVSTVALGAGTGSGVRDVRVEGSVRYDSAKFNGLTFGLSYDPKNTGHTTATTNNVGHTNVGLNYANGPLNVSYAYANFANPTGVANSIGSLKHNLLAANYNLGAFTVYGGYTTSKGATAAAGDTNANSWNMAAKFAVNNNIDLMANFLRVNDKTLGNVDRRLNGLGMDYKFSKRTSAYLRYESGDHTKINTAAGKFTNYAAGLRHAF